MLQYNSNLTFTHQKSSPFLPLYFVISAKILCVTDKTLTGELRTLKGN